MKIVYINYKERQNGKSFEKIMKATRQHLEEKASAYNIQRESL